jgi:murein DD-endopeptidase MepM/ murein hydrolase activator NlpD
LKVPLDTDPRIHDQLAALPAAKATGLPDYAYRHKIRQGETLTKIASRYHVSVAALEKANKLSPKAKLVPGTWIQVPSHALIPKSVVASNRTAAKSGTIKTAAKNGTVKTAAKSGTTKTSGKNGTTKMSASRTKVAKSKSASARNRSSKTVRSATARSKAANPQIKADSLRKQPQDSAKPNQVASR